MRVNYYMTKVITAVFECHLEYMFVYFVFAIVFSILTVVGVSAAAGPLVPLAFVTAVSCWVLLVAEMYFFQQSRKP